METLVLFRPISSKTIVRKNKTPKTLPLIISRFFILRSLLNAKGSIKMQARRLLIPNKVKGPIVSKQTLEKM